MGRGPPQCPSSCYMPAVGLPSSQGGTGLEHSWHVHTVSTRWGLCHSQDWEVLGEHPPPPCPVCSQTVELRCENGCVPEKLILILIRSHVHVLQTCTRCACVQRGLHMVLVGAGSPSVHWSLEYISMLMCVQVCAEMSRRRCGGVVEVIPEPGP